MSSEGAGIQAEVEAGAREPAICSPGSTPLPTLTPGIRTTGSTGDVPLEVVSRTEQHVNGTISPAPLICQETLPEDDFDPAPLIQTKTESADKVDGEGTFDPFSIMVWKEGVGTLQGSNLSFKVDDQGSLEMIDEEEAEKVRQGYRKNKTQGKEDTRVLKSLQTVVAAPTKDPHVPSPLDQRQCANCGNTGHVVNFVRAGKFCSQECATSQANKLRQLTAGATSSTVRPGESLIKPKSLLNTGKGYARPANGSELGSRSSSPSAGNMRRQGDESSAAALKIKRQRISEGENRDHHHLLPARRKSSEGQSLVMKKPFHGKKSKFGVRMKDRFDVLVDGNSNNDSEKLSLPSSPSSSLVNITPQSALHQSIFSMRVCQHQQEPPISWEKHSLNLKPVLKDIKPLEVLKWTPEQVADFVNSVPGCQDVGQTFADELIDGEAFLLLNQTDIVKVLNIKLGPAVKIYNSVILIRDSIEVA